MAVRVQDEATDNLAVPGASVLEDLAEVATPVARWTCSICCLTFGGEENKWVLECCHGTHQICCARLRKCPQIGMSLPRSAHTAARRLWRAF